VRVSVYSFALKQQYHVGSGDDSARHKRRIDTVVSIERSGSIQRVGLAVFMRFYVPLIVFTLVVCVVWSLYLMPSVFELFLHHEPRE
jgi:hypothetical protein